MSKMKTSAYTIMELSIAMLVSGILIGIVFTVFHIVAGTHRSYNKKNEDMAEIINMESLLKRDFLRSRVVIRNPTGFYCAGLTDTVYYEFLPDKLVRTQGVIDTFRVAPLSVALTFEGREVPVSGGQENDRIDCLFFNLQYRGQDMPFQFQKIYSSEDLNNYKNAIN